MIAPDAANWGIKAAYLFAGQLIPMTVLVYFFYPEVRLDVRSSQSLADTPRQLAGPTSS